MFNMLVWTDDIWRGPFCKDSLSSHLITGAHPQKHIDQNGPGQNPERTQMACRSDYTISVAQRRNCLEQFAYRRSCFLWALFFGLVGQGCTWWIQDATRCTPLDPTVRGPQLRAIKTPVHGRR